MPLYEYQCDVCAHRFEVIQKFSDAPVSECRACGGAVRKLLSSPAIQFKGSGWYITDYAKKPGGSTPAGKEGGASSASGSSDTTSTAKTGESSSSSTSSGSGSTPSPTTPAPKAS